MDRIIHYVFLQFVEVFIPDIIIILNKLCRQTTLPIVGGTQLHNSLVCIKLRRFSPEGSALNSIRLP